MKYALAVLLLLSATGCKLSAAAALTPPEIRAIPASQAALNATAAPQVRAGEWTDEETATFLEAQAEVWRQLDRFYQGTSEEAE